jgi:mannose-6-phosphate isomerase-like protein (cupin superfamily)
MGKLVREFATYWGGDDRLWFERDEDDLIGTQRAGGCRLPRIRICDLASGPTNQKGAKAPVLWSGEDGVVEIHHTVGAEPHFHRPSNFDVLILQFAGSAAIESEFGEFRLSPGHAMHVPAGSAYRVIGNPHCYQLIGKIREPFEVNVDPTKPLTETVFNVHPKGSNTASEPVGFPERRGKILEVTEFWGDVTPSITIERDHAKLVGCAQATSSRKATVLRAFDYFCGTTGKGGIRAPELFKGKNFKVDVYNTVGQQHGFHRGCDSEEIWFQFRGSAINDTEWGSQHLNAGEISYAPRGISHRITGDENFLRFNMYFHCLMRPQVDEKNHQAETHYEVETASHQELPAFSEARAKIEAAQAKNTRPRM